MSNNTTTLPSSVWSTDAEAIAWLAGQPVKEVLHAIVRACGGLTASATKRHGGYAHWGAMPKEKLVAALCDEYAPAYLYGMAKQTEKLRTGTTETEAKPEAKPEAKATVEAKPIIEAKPDTNPLAAALAAALEAAMPKAKIDEATVRAMLAEAIEAERPKLIEHVAGHVARTVVITTPEVPKVEVGVQHQNFDLLVRSMAARIPNGRRLNVWLYGPAGTGKTSAARAAAKAFDVPFYYSGAIETTYALLGYTDAHGRVVRTPFREAWEHGGVFLMDEIDASHDKAVNGLNAAIDADLCAFPDGMIPRHANTYIVAGANTTGRGADSKYSGRTKLDEAALTRWVMLEWPHDPKLEAAIVGNDAAAKLALLIVGKFRKAADAERIGGASTSSRAVLDMSALLRAKLPLDAAVQMSVRKGMPSESWERPNTAAMRAAKEDTGFERLVLEVGK